MEKKLLSDGIWIHAFSSETMITLQVTLSRGRFKTLFPTQGDTLFALG